MDAHHLQTIENLQARFEPDADVLALIILGSVARGEARPGSDVDFYLVVTESRYNQYLATGDTCIDAHELSVAPCTEANGYLLWVNAMQEMKDSGSEIDRWTFTQARVVFSKDLKINRLAVEISCYPETGRIRRMESFHSQMAYHISFFEFAYLSQTKYLIYANRYQADPLYWTIDPGR